MSGTVSFLIGLGRALAALQLYDRGHPARERAIGDALRLLEALLSKDTQPTFTILGDVVVYNGRLVHGLRAWTAGPRLFDAGMQRIEFFRPVSRSDFEAFLEAAEAASEGRPPPPETEHPSIRYGLAAVSDTDLEFEADSEADIESLLGAEIEAMKCVLDQAENGRGVQRQEVEGIVGSLLLAVVAGESFSAPLLRLKDHDQYTTAHSLNVAVLSMALAQFSGYSREQVRAIGVAGVLHDIGKVRVPREILVKSGALTAAERQAVNEHPREGARIILDSDQADLGLAAVVAYEHHIWYDSRGYPVVRPPRSCHPASNLVHVCDVFDALATDRPYRSAWREAAILDLIKRNSGTEFDPFPAAALLRMMTQKTPPFRVLEAPSLASPALTI